MSDEQQPTDGGTRTRIVSAPSMTLPRGGGAIRGIGEKFAANPVTGTGSLSVPIATSPGRAGFGPGLSLSYDSGAGNGAFGFGWRLSLPSITRKTDRGIPQYRDAEESDVFLLSGAEDLVPVLAERASGWVREPAASRIDRGAAFEVQRYRPRIEGLFARIERWTDTRTGDTHWRSLSRHNVTTIYGRDSNSRIFDPSDPNLEHPGRIFAWLVCESYDDKGNAIVYEYKPENGDGVNVARTHERNRTAAGRSANRYPKRIRYGNRLSRLVEPALAAAEWMFEVVFDYGEHDADDPKPADAGTWHCRHDPFSTCRAGFEVRTYRLCQRVLMFHHFPGEDGVGANCLVRSTDFTYRDLRDNPDDARRGHPLGSFIASITQNGYKRRAPSGYLKRTLPPLELEYAPATIHDEVREVDAASLENLPHGLDGTNYHWVDLDGDGVSGILTEQGGAWYYKANLSPVAATAEDPARRVRFAPAAVVATLPSLAALGSGRQQLLDLAGDGQLDVVALGGPTPGFFERTHDGGWTPFRPIARLPRVDWHDPNLRFVDLDGDGLADVLITEHDVFTWHASLAEEGFSAARRVPQAPDEEQGPRLVLSDGMQSIYLADMSGDGLTDLVRVRNGEVCYWPNLGYGRFGARVAMDGSPWLDAPDLFHQQRIRLADIDGSGTVDLLYLGGDGVRLYFNESGNGWSGPRRLDRFPRIDNVASVAAVDLLGNGTACLVWSSPLPEDADRPMRYVDLMGGRKPHLLVAVRNNLGAETSIQYSSSTSFHVADKLAGTPWITRLPFPVHVVTRVETCDRFSGSRFVTRYTYHHGYFDGVEREFRGFGRVEQVDTESFGAFAAGHADSRYITADRTLYQAPVKTITWFHLGAFAGRDRILSHFRDEYFTSGSTGFREHELQEPDLASQGLSTDEWREALRACKGAMLRQEVYELDIDALERGEHRPVKLFSAASRSCDLRMLQSHASNRHAVFLATEAEAITYQYELDLRSEPLVPDPRVAHTLNLRFDELGNVLQSVTAVYPRIGRHADASLPLGAEELIARTQREMHLTYTETRYTNDVNDAADYRLRIPCEVNTCALTGVEPHEPHSGASLPRYFTLDRLRRFRLSGIHQAEGHAVEEIPYHHLPDRRTPQKRGIQHVRTLFFDDGRPMPVEPFPFGRLGPRGLRFETYTLALTDSLLAGTLGPKLDAEARRQLGDASASGYLSGADLQARFRGVSTEGEYWSRSGIEGFGADARNHFYLPTRYTDPFGHTTAVAYDGRYDLYVESSIDPLGNRTRVTAFDFRVLAPRELEDVNGNVSEVCYDIMGLPVAMALKGKGAEGDDLTAIDDDVANPALAALTAFFIERAYDEELARAWLGRATVRHIYSFGERPRADGSIEWGTHPACACGIRRERHAADLVDGGSSPLQTVFEYSDGTGTVLVSKLQAEPEVEGSDVRWIASGKTVRNNKGKPVKQYEPSFSPREVAHRFEEPVEMGVTSVMYYDALGRLVRTDAPDGTFSRVEFSPWHEAAFDVNDTVRESRWFEARNPPDPAQPLPRDPTMTAGQRAAWLAAQHDGTPLLILLDSAGRPIANVAHNRYRDSRGILHDEKYVTVTRLDAEGRPLWIRDARRNLVTQYITPPVPNDQAADPERGVVPAYDLTGHLLFQHSMDAGDRWMLADAAGQPFYAWDENQLVAEDGTISPEPERRTFHTTYDALRRPREQRLRLGDDPGWQVIERFEYRDPAAASRTPDAEAARLNLGGHTYRHYDQSGLVTNERFDFKGNLVEIARRLASAYHAPVIHWPDAPGPGSLGERFVQVTEYDALNRATRLYNWHRGEDSRVAVYESRYNERGLLKDQMIVVGATRTAAGYIEEGPDGRVATRVAAILAMAYNARGQRERIDYGNGTTTACEYDPETFRLTTLTTTGARPRAVFQHLHYTYDPSGHVVEIRDDAQQTVYFANTRVDPHGRYVYDALYRLIAAEGREHAFQNNVQRDNHPFEPITAIPFPNSPEALQPYEEAYEYDAVGNMLSMSHSGGFRLQWKRCYQYARDSNRLLATGTPDDLRNPADPCPRHYVDAPTLAHRYEHDLHGSMLTLYRTASAYRLRWDYRDMIHRVNLGGGGTAWYAYDTDRQRTRARVERSGGSIEERLYLGGMEILRREGGGTPAQELERHHLFVDDERVLIIDDVLRGGRSGPAPGVLLRYQYGNHLGSVALEMSGDAQVISYEEYHPYGTTAYEARNRAVRAAAKCYRYTGMETDAETGLSYHQARYYLPWLGRWCSADPLGLVDGLNIFAYGGCNPCSQRDRRGTDDEEWQLSPLQDVSRPAYGVRLFDEQLRLDIGPGELDEAKAAEAEEQVNPPEDTLDELMLRAAGGLEAADTAIAEIAAEADERLREIDLNRRLMERVEVDLVILGVGDEGSRVARRPDLIVLTPYAGDPALTFLMGALGVMTMPIPDVAIGNVTAHSAGGRFWQSAEASGFSASGDVSVYGGLFGNHPQLGLPSSYNSGDWVQFIPVPVVLDPERLPNGMTVPGEIVLGGAISLPLDLVFAPWYPFPRIVSVPGHDWRGLRFGGHGPTDYPEVTGRRRGAEE